MVCNNFRVYRCLENGTGIFQISAKFCRIDQVTIVCQCQSTFYIIKYQRLCILTGRSTCCRISGVPYTDIAMKSFQIIRCKHLIYQSHAFIRGYFAFWTASLTNSNTTALLSSVLESKQSIIYCGRNILAIKIIDAEHTTFFVQFIVPRRRN